MRPATLMIIAAVLAIGVSAALAQVVIPASGGSSGFLQYQDHASTAAEGAMRGMGALVRSDGQRNLDNSAAAINYSVARKNEIANQQYYTETYFNMRKVNREARAAERAPRGTKEDFIRYAQEGAPKRLSPSELNVVTGALGWPAILQDGAFKEDRQKLDNYFAYRAKHGAIDFKNIMKATEMITGMEDELKENIRKLPPNATMSQQYLLARNFLKSLRYEAGQPPQ